MNRFIILLHVILLALIVLHLFYSIDFENLFSPLNKGGATGIMVSILGMVALLLSSREKPGETDVS